MTKRVYPIEDIEALFDRVNRVTRIIECIPNIMSDIASLYDLCYQDLEEVKQVLDVTKDNYELE